MFYIDFYFLPDKNNNNNWLELLIYSYDSDGRPCGKNFFKKKKKKN